MNSGKIKTSLYKVLIYTVCIALAVLSLMPFIIMIINATRSTYQVQEHAVSFIPSNHLLDNWKVFNGKTFNPLTGFFNSLIISTGSTACAIYFSTLTAFALFAYNWRMRQPFFSMILAGGHRLLQVHVSDWHDEQPPGIDPSQHRRAGDCVLHAAIHAVLA
jgi:multiple sugar transport system permease protein